MALVEVPAAALQQEGQHMPRDGVDDRLRGDVLDSLQIVDMMHALHLHTLNTWTLPISMVCGR